MNGYKIVDKSLQEYDQHKPQVREANKDGRNTKFWSSNPDFNTTNKDISRPNKPSDDALEVARKQGELEAAKKYRQEFGIKDAKIRAEVQKRISDAAREVAGYGQLIKQQDQKLRELQVAQSKSRWWHIGDQIDNDANKKLERQSRSSKKDLNRRRAAAAKRMDLETRKLRILQQQYERALSKKSAWEVGMKNALIASALIGTGILASYVYSKIKARWSIWKTKKKTASKTSSEIEDNVFQMKALNQAEKELDDVSNVFQNDEDVVRRTKTVKNQIHDKKIVIQRKMQEYDPDQLRHYTYYN